MIDQNTQLLGQAPAWLSAQEHVSRVAPLDRPILVIGERGTGKELIGERLHFLSKRWDGPFVKVNCAALSETLLDSELFGHERGAFTGATEMRRGRFELADGGTIFLDEIATASDQVQEKLLRVVEYGEFQRVGGSKVLATDVRIVAATNADLPGMVEAGEFRADCTAQSPTEAAGAAKQGARIGAFQEPEIERRFAYDHRVDVDHLVQAVAEPGGIDGRAQGAVGEHLTPLGALRQHLGNPTILGL